MRIPKVLALCLMALGTATGSLLLPPEARAEGESRAPDATAFTLDNGLEVVVIEDHRAPIVTQMVWYRIGSADEPAGKSGIAHFLEHLMFKGTEKIAPDQFSALIEAQGGSDNAFTSYDCTAYFQRIAADRLEMVMEMEADRMQNLRLDEASVTTERDVVLEERAQRTESAPAALLREQVNAALYQNHRYGMPVVGWRHEVEQLSREDALDWYRRYYAPNNAILVIAGDVTPDQVRALAQKHFGAIPPSEGLSERRRPQEPPAVAERRVRLEDERVSVPALTRAYLAPSRDPGAQKEAAATQLLAEVLGGRSESSFLNRALVLDSRIAVSAFADYDGDAIDSGRFDLFVTPAAGVSLEEAEAALDAALARFLREGVDAGELERAKVQLRASEIYQRDSAFYRANIYGAGLSLGLGLQDIEGYIAIAGDVTAEEVMAAARKVLNRKASVTGWLMKPEGAGEPEMAPQAAAPSPATDEEVAQ